ncbi:hypothetical protein [Aquimarina algicola]|uniref:Uncharacterized protein n=1 Tax=Aquimarina algicola TaxID=2589995 RepID=A0A504IY98_9FLAO|nr:hypothetical protein [Aquimarina algicola]TPN83024.1 hypothetical protein FHK87_21615 [Aquimarina algicola]
MNILEKERIVKKNILELFKESFNVSRTDDEILNIKPEKEFNTNNCKGYYESILDIFLIEDKHKESITGEVKDTVKKVVELWPTSNSNAVWNWQMQ